MITLLLIIAIGSLTFHDLTLCSLFAYLNTHPFLFILIIAEIINSSFTINLKSKT
jgi:hypothetical protein